MKEELAVSPVGPAFEELTLEEMHMIHGGGDVVPETTPICGYFIGVGAGVVFSVYKC
ncbi:mersacidin family lantibiotic [Paenibacillus apiarius]|uniref:Lichenicidin A2 family type 2 lantibiotic n=1 Tax=Paenibacillus apiarius TaxID=46240 RepID=A0ABT4DS93_9BACL|nr:lichenicidin A2 family type 2 lantibiotic [Paenibacillus apiarius]MCY9515487.1 lichenicidin A2 family type 2 lantibiotic [Paenibacillus apiarius]MCY9518896.1 lichenicidin A2 family type 2 lantibiotic [Paenibacillus apiarius]MCY9552058.1 lichenicidin A2 family type 2 lantibiotic [Paenibacillus apiarius]MCY9557266.1 lichenicidin A2 family type 2 lantibiotic [Paenibacillus apiarius]MCY9682555.1 lichenicidin A2 family type 2 lantibiotic [Paenibacillus apiarius]